MTKPAPQEFPPRLVAVLHPVTVARKMRDSGEEHTPRSSIWISLIEHEAIRQADRAQEEKDYESLSKKYLDEQEKVAALEAENATLKEILQVIAGHSNCYCDECNKISRKYWKP